MNLQKNYFGHKLKTTIHKSISEIETDAPLPDWSRVDMKNYLDKKAEIEAIIHPI